MEGELHRWETTIAASLRARIILESSWQPLAVFLF